MDPLLAARMQMGLSLVFHIIFAAIGIGLPALMVVAEFRYLRTGQPHYLRLTKKWAKATGLLYAIGAISGTALAFQIGLLWPHFMEITGAVVGHLFGLEGFAFFLEAIFIGLYLYGWDRMSPWAHWSCGLVIAISGAASGVLVLGVNAWMQQPVGFHWQHDALTDVNPLAIFSSYGWITMAIHSTLSCYVAVGFAAAGIYAYRYRQHPGDPYRRSAIRIAMAIGGICALLQPVSGDMLAKFVFHSQPAKFAAMEGQFKTQTYAPLRIGGIPDPDRHETRFAIEIPGGLSFLATHHPSAEVPGLDSVPREDWPNVRQSHFAFQIMVGSGIGLMLLSAWFWIASWRKGINALNNIWLTRLLVAAGSFGFIALEAGWFVTEAGRQPWAIQPNAAIGFPGLRISAAVTPAAGVSPLFFGFSLLYLILAIVVIQLLRGLMESPDNTITLQDRGASTPGAP